MGLLVLLLRADASDLEREHVGERGRDVESTDGACTRADTYGGVLRGLRKPSGCLALGAERRGARTVSAGCARDGREVLTGA